MILAVADVMRGGKARDQDVARMLLADLLAES